MSKTKDLLKGRLAAATSRLDLIRERIKEAELAKTKLEDELVAARKDVEDIKAAIEAIPVRSN